MHYLILCGLVLITAMGYDLVKRNYKNSESVQIFLVAAIIFMLSLFTGLRRQYNDTYAYVDGFIKTGEEFPELFKGEFKLSNTFIFPIWTWFIKNIIADDVTVYLFLCSIVFVGPSVYLMHKYSKDLTFSLVLFLFGGPYLFSFGAVRQMMAAGIVLMAVPALLKKKYVTYYVFFLIAFFMHTYSLFLVVLPILGLELFNKRTIVFMIAAIIVGLGLSLFTGLMTEVIAWFGEDISEDRLTEDYTINILRFIVYWIPSILMIISKREVQEGVSDGEKVMMKMSLLSSGFITLALFGNPVLFGRLPYFFYVGTMVSLPYVVQKAFQKNTQRPIYVIAAILYTLYGFYDLYNASAFTGNRFGLIWF
ncbi:MAG: EpsG family protein [Clostridia bacterium]|nr:EpsG family protein [Clostridia bacterium]